MRDGGPAHSRLAFLNSRTTITFATQAAGYIRIIQTGSTPGTFWSIDELNVFGTAPLAPASLTATAVGEQFNLLWAASAGASGYNLKRTTLSCGAYTTIAANLGYVNYSDSGLANGTLYYYVVTATNIWREP